MGYTMMGNVSQAAANNVASGATIIDTVTPATSRGILKTANVWSTEVGVGKIKVFRDDGTNFVFVGESGQQAIAIGQNTLTCWIPVEKGDLIGNYILAVTNGNVGANAGVAYWKAGDVTTTSAKATYAGAVDTISCEGKVFSRVQPI